MQSDIKLKIPENLYEVLKNIDYSDFQGEINLDDNELSLETNRSDFLDFLSDYILYNGLEGSEYAINDLGVMLYKLYDYVCYNTKQ